MNLANDVCDMQRWGKITTNGNTEIAIRWHNRNRRTINIECNIKRRAPKTYQEEIFTARCYASAVLAMGL